MRNALDLGNQIKLFFACSSEGAGDIPSLVTAGGTGDGTKRTGETIDRLDSNGGMAQSAKLGTSWHAELDNTETLSLTHELQESADGTNWDSAVTIEAVTVKQTATADAVYRGCDEHIVSLVGRKRYIRFNTTLTLGASADDIATFHSVAALGGYDVEPVS